MRKEEPRPTAEGMQPAYMRPCGSDTLCREPRTSDSRESNIAVKLDPIFAMYIADFEKGLRFVSMKLKDLRSRAMFLLRVKTFGRSADMSVINRIFTTDPDCEVAGIIGNRALDVIEQVRYDFPKTWATIGRFIQYF